MKAAGRLGLLGLGLLCLMLLTGTERIELPAAEQLAAVRLRWEVPAPNESPRPAPTPEPESGAPEEPLQLPAAAVETGGADFAPLSREEILETSIPGGLSIKNETGLAADPAELLRDGPPQRLSAEGVQILILHTHGSEAYTPAGLDRYESEDRCRSEDTQLNIIRVGDELTALFEQAGLRVIHDREIYDYPSYTGSYTRSGEAVRQILSEHPEISVVLDVHRDALGTDDVVYKTMAEEEGVCASQIMLLVGSDESGLEHPRWRENLALALYLQQAVSARHPTLLRPVDLVPQRYNQHLCSGMLIVEVGSSGNTLQEALAAIRLFADAAAPALLALTADHS